MRPGGAASPPPGQIAVLLWAVPVVLAAACGPPEPSAPAGFLRGMTLGIFSVEDPAAIDGALDEIGALGVDAVSLVVPLSVPHARSLEIRPGRWLTPGDEAIRSAIRGARRRGMEVMLFPILFLGDVRQGEWRGTLAPPDWGSWFDGYGEVIRRFAGMAEDEGAGLLCVGSELLSSERHEAEWRSLIASVREVYGGKLVYSANWDHYRDVGFLDALDYLGVNAYHELTRSPRPEVDELRRSWEPIRADLVAWSRRHGTRLLFTEVGYPSRDGAAADPWNYEADRPVNLEVQRRCYQAFVETWRNVPELAGVFFYLWWGEGGPQDRDYTPRGKPAEEVISGWFGPGGPEGRR